MSTTTTQETSRTRAEAPQGACVVPYRALQDALRTTALGTGKQVPVLGQVMVEFRTDGRVTLTTYNYDSAVTVTLEGSVSVAGRMLVRHDTMTKVLAAAVKGARKAVLDSATVDLEVVGPPELIQAQPGPYKVKPPNPGGLDISAESETAFETSAGEDRDAAFHSGLHAS